MSVSAPTTPCQVIGGKGEGRSGQSSEDRPKAGTVYVEDLNMIKRHQRASPRRTAGPGQEGGIIEMEGPIHVSNVALVDRPTTNRPDRRPHLDDGVRQRYSKRTGEPFRRSWRATTTQQAVPPPRLGTPSTSSPEADGDLRLLDSGAGPAPSEDHPEHGPPAPPRLTPSPAKDVRRAGHDRRPDAEHGSPKKSIRPSKASRGNCRSALR